MNYRTEHSHPRPAEGPTPSRAQRRHHRATVRRRRALAVAALALITGTVTGLAVTGHRADITITDDGTSTLVSARKGRTVAQELAARHIKLSRADRVSPDTATPITDSTRITIVRAKDVSVAVDGTVRPAEVAATTVADVRGALGARPGAVVEVSRGQTRTALSGTDKLPAGATITVRNPQRVTVTADGRTRTVTTTALTLEDALRAANVSRDSNDLLRRTPARATTLPVTGDHLTLTRVSTSTRTRTTTVPAPTRTVNDPKAPVGSRKVARPGKPGKVVTTQRLTTHDGVVVAVKTLKTTRTAPVTQVVNRGTRKPAPKPTPAPVHAASPVAQEPVAPHTAGLNWEALARCESTGNPAAVSPGGLYRGLYQFSMRTWASVGGAGDPAKASAAEQTRRAQILYGRAGAGQWPVCGKYL